MTIALAGMTLAALIDTGCSNSLVNSNIAKRLGASLSNYSGGPITVLDGRSMQVFGQCKTTIYVAKDCYFLEFLVVDLFDLGFDVILGSDFVQAVGGLTIASDLSVSMVPRQPGAALCGISSQLPENSTDYLPKNSCPEEICISDKDFEVTFNGRHWTLKWIWVDGPKGLQNRKEHYRIRPELQPMYDEEINRWIADGMACAERRGRTWTDRRDYCVYSQGGTAKKSCEARPGLSPA